MNAPFPIPGIEKVPETVRLAFEGKPHMTLAELALALKIDVKTLRGMCDAGKIGFVQKGDGQKRRSRMFTLGHVCEYLGIDLRPPIPENLAALSDRELTSLLVRERIRRSDGRQIAMDDVLARIEREAARRRPRRCRRFRGEGRKGTIYFVGHDDRIKIGFSTEPEQRIKVLQIANPERLMVHLLMPGSEAAEASLHERFSGHRIAGEWFRLAPEIEQFIAEHQS